MKIGAVAEFGHVRYLISSLRVCFLTRSSISFRIWDILVLARLKSVSFTTTENTEEPR